MGVAKSAVPLLRCDSAFRRKRWGRYIYLYIYGLRIRRFTRVVIGTVRTACVLILILVYRSLRVSASPLCVVETVNDRTERRKKITKNRTSNYLLKVSVLIHQFRISKSVPVLCGPCLNIVCPYGRSALQQLADTVSTSSEQGRTEQQQWPSFYSTPPSSHTN